VYTLNLTELFLTRVALKVFGIVFQQFQRVQVTAVIVLSIQNTLLKGM